MVPIEQVLLGPAKNARPLMSDPVGVCYADSEKLWKGAFVEGSASESAIQASVILARAIAAESEKELPADGRVVEVMLMERKRSR